MDMRCVWICDVYRYVICVNKRGNRHMKWKKYTIETTTAAEDFLAGMLMELGIE